MAKTAIIYIYDWKHLLQTSLYYNTNNILFHLPTSYVLIYNIITQSQN